MQRFPWRFAVYLVAGLYLFADLAIWKGPLHQRLTRPWRQASEGAGKAAHVVTVYGRPITRLELAEAMRRYLWKRGEAWDELGDLAQQQTRQLVLEQLINNRLVSAFRVMNGLERKPEESVVRHEVEMLRRQFEQPGDWEQRLAWQGWTEAEFEQEVEGALADEAWIEEKIAHRLAEVTDSVVRQSYEAGVAAGDFKVPERFRVSHLFLTAHDPQKQDRRAEVAALDEELKRVATNRAGFETLVAARSEDDRTRVREGDLGWFEAERMPASFVGAVRKAPVGELSGPVRTPLGWHWLWVIEKRGARTAEFEEVKEELRSMLLSRQRETAVRVLLGELRSRSVRPTRFLHYFHEVIEATVPASTDGNS